MNVHSEKLVYIHFNSFDQRFIGKIDENSQIFTQIRIDLWNHIFCNQHKNSDICHVFIAKAVSYVIRYVGWKINMNELWRVYRQVKECSLLLDGLNFYMVQWSLKILRLLISFGVLQLFDAVGFFLLLFFVS